MLMSNGNVAIARSIFLASWAAMATLAFASAHAQSTIVPPTIAVPIVDVVDNNHVSILTGRTQFSIPALQFGGLSFAPYSWAGVHFQQGGIIDSNYGAVNICTNFSQTIGGNVICSTVTGGIQVTHGEDRANFGFSGTSYSPDAQDGSTFVDNGATCTWTKKDGTQIIYYAFHTPATSPMCQSNAISSIVHPDGRIDTYYYYGSTNGAGGLERAYNWSPILSIATNTGYMLKYLYSGTPVFGSETNVIGINLAFQSCSPTALTCTPTSPWPTATLSWVTDPVLPCDNYPTGGVINPCNHYTFTIQDAALRNHIFQLDSYYRVISYQPPEANAPVFNYTLCSLLNQDTDPSGQPMSNCFGITRDYICQNGVHCGFNTAPYLWDLVSTVTRNSATWTYSSIFGYAGSPMAAASWAHGVTSPLGLTMGATGNGNATSYEFARIGPTADVQLYDGTVYNYEASTRNVLTTATSPLGVVKTFTYDLAANGVSRSNLVQIQTTPIAGSGTIAPNPVKATYPEPGVYPCASIMTCNKPVSITDANGHETDFTYDPAHGGLLTEIDPAVQVNGAGALIRPQTTRIYMQYSARYLNSSGVMASDPKQVWLLTNEKHCMTDATNATGGCVAPNGQAAPNDQVVTTYSYGPNLGPNNLLLRDKTISSNGQGLQYCYGHDPQGNTIWETSPNAKPATCQSY
jgi:YD repeat-containing protein